MNQSGHHPNGGVATMAASMLLARGPHTRPVFETQHGLPELLWAAVQLGDNFQTQALLLAGVDPNTVDPGSSNGTVLIEGCSRGHIEVVKVLIANGADVNRPNPDTKDTPLMRACQSNDIKCARLLLDSGADPNASRSDNGATALAKAVHKGNRALALLLLDRGADPNAAPSPTGWTALMRAAQTGHLQCLQMLLNRGVDPNQRKTDTHETALHFAAYGGHTDCVLQLLEQGADPESRTTSGRGKVSALMAAAQNGYGLLVQVLTVFGASNESRREASGIASKFYRRSVLDWFNHIDGLSPVYAGIAARQIDVTKLALRTGRIDTIGIMPSQLIAATVRPFGTPTIDQATVTFARHVGLPWSPETHALYHRTFRDAVRVVMLIALRQQRASGTKESESQEMVQKKTIVLPIEMWLRILSFLLRSHWRPALPVAATS